MLAPFRFTAQWAVFPLLAAMAVILGVSVGGFAGWLEVNPGSGPLLLRQLFLSTLPAVASIVLLGIVTNSWSIATISGAFASFAVYFGQEVAEARWASHYAVDATKLVMECSLAVIGGGLLGLGACLWQHEDGMPRAVGAGMLGGALVWSGGRDLIEAGWPRDGDYLVSWLCLALAAFVVLRFGRLGLMTFALIEAVAVAWVATTLQDERTLDLTSFASEILRELQEMTRRFRDGL